MGKFFIFPFWCGVRGKLSTKWRFYDRVEQQNVIVRFQRDPVYRNKNMRITITEHGMAICELRILRNRKIHESTITNSIVS